MPTTFISFSTSSAVVTVMVSPTFASINSANLSVMILILLPALVTGFLVTPVLHYHNVLQFIINVLTYIANPRRYYWRGWCVKYDSEDKQ